MTSVGRAETSFARVYWNFGSSGHISPSSRERGECPVVKKTYWTTGSVRLTALYSTSYRAIGHWTFTGHLMIVQKSLDIAKCPLRQGGETLNKQGKTLRYPETGGQNPKCYVVK